MNKTTPKKKILFVHFRLGKTDGVSIEMSHWKQILERKGHKVYFCAGPISEGADFIIEKLEQQLDPQVFSLDQQAFGQNVTYTEEEFNKQLDKIQTEIKNDFENVIKKLNPDQIVISNIFSVGEHIAAPKALLDILDKYKIPTLLVHHDFYWENERYQKPAYKSVEKLLANSYAPKRPYIKHACINSIAQKALKERHHIDTIIIYDTIDFKQKQWKKDDYNNDILQNWKINSNDIIILQATRIVRRKNIELSIDYTKKLQAAFDNIAEAKAKLYKNKYFYKNKSKVYLVLAGYAEKRDMEYFKELMYYAALQKINFCYIGDQIGYKRNNHNNKKEYSLWDAYAASDIITYPSEYEGFGNQFLEAMFAKKPIVTFEYPVFKTDIKDKGVNYISLGDKLAVSSELGLKTIPPKTLDKAVNKSFDLLTNREKYFTSVCHNFEIGKTYFSFEKTAEVLSKGLSSTKADN